MREGSNEDVIQEFIVMAVLSTVFSIALIRKPFDKREFVVKCVCVPERVKK